VLSLLTVSASTSPVRTGDVLAGKYRVERVLGVGGMGVVVCAMHLQLEQRMALKFLLADAATEPLTRERFAREARAAVRLKSEHVARTVDVGTLDSGSPYIVMEYLEGTDLADILRRDGPLPVTVVADYVIQALDAVAEAHSIGIVHRDLKPSNLFLTRRADGSAWVKVLDFGISKESPATGDAALTGTHTVIGSPTYMSPEHMRASKMADARSDIWSLGVILYELISGRAPFSATAFSTLVINVVMDAAPPLVAPEPLPDGFEAVVHRCLEKDPTRRFQSAAELAAALAPFAPASGLPIVERIRKLTTDRMQAVQTGDQEAPAPSDPAFATIVNEPVFELAPTMTSPLSIDKPTVLDAPRRPGRRPLRMVGLVAGLIGAVALTIAIIGPADPARDRPPVDEPVSTAAAPPAQTAVEETPEPAPRASRAAPLPALPPADRRVEALDDRKPAPRRPKRPPRSRVTPSVEEDPFATPE
jgi:eukaryotic-like serine/threonine-protein kinase